MAYTKLASGSGREASGFLLDFAQSFGRTGQAVGCQSQFSFVAAAGEESGVRLPVSSLGKWSHFSAQNLDSIEEGLEDITVKYPF